MDWHSIRVLDTWPKMWWRVLAPNCRWSSSDRRFGNSLCTSRTCNAIANPEGDISRWWQGLTSSHHLRTYSHKGGVASASSASLCFVTGHCCSDNRRAATGERSQLPLSPPSPSESYAASAKSTIRELHRTLQDNRVQSGNTRFMLLKAALCVVIVKRRKIAHHSMPRNR